MKRADNRRSVSETITLEIQNDNLIPAGRNKEGYDRFFYTENSPRLVKKITKRYIGTASEINQSIEAMLTALEAVDGALSGTFLTAVDPQDGFIIIEGDIYFEYTETWTDYGFVELSSPEFFPIPNYSASVAPSGYMPDGRAYFATDLAGLTISTQETLPFEKAVRAEPMEPGPKGGILTSINVSNVREINNKLWADSSKTYMEKEASIRLTV